MYIDTHTIYRQSEERIQGIHVRRSAVKLLIGYFVIRVRN